MLYVVGIVVLVGRQYDGVGTAAPVGAGIGLLAYSTYDLTSMATTKVHLEDHCTRPGLGHLPHRRSRSGR